ncbi:2-aminoethylphosphonate--pyruvate transaminase [Portunus trituberculatus]|uniref:2-aminoethylphosphonate--pyruvate transaminase n=1 Tax=Portunus trituberculatus TaxID=210409 RepID=A0A5B7DIF7_PORTR|nr:2-aminoethylphosphonate--pyruvate transaminase [Portunus trituberculatus]
MVPKKCSSVFPGTVFFVDAMSSFGAVPLDLTAAKIDYLVSSANKCLEGVPGFSYAICRKKHLLSCKDKIGALMNQYYVHSSKGMQRYVHTLHGLL